MTPSSVSHFSGPDNDLSDKGQAFTHFIHQQLCQKRYRSTDTRQPGLYPLSPLEPQYVFEVNGRNTRIAVESRFRQADYRKKFTWADQEQVDVLNRFQQRTKIPVFVVIGLGGLPAKPSHLYVVPFDKICQYHTVDFSTLEAFECNTGGEGIVFDI